MGLFDKIRGLIESGSPVKGIHSDFNIYSGPWATNSTREIRPEAKLRFGFDDPKVLDRLNELGWIAKIGINNDDFARDDEIRYGSKYIGFIYGDKKNRDLLETWAQDRIEDGLLPEKIEIYENEPEKTSIRPDGTSVDGIPPRIIFGREK